MVPVDYPTMHNWSYSDTAFNRTLGLRTPNSVDMTEDNLEENSAERDVALQSRAGSSYWDLTDLRRATNPKRHFPKSVLPF